MKAKSARITVYAILILISGGYLSYRYYFNSAVSRNRFVKEWIGRYAPRAASEPTEKEMQHLYRLAQAAVACTKQRVVYDSRFFKIPYPNGDVPRDRGVCTDLVIRAYRLIGIDLQERVHRDMQTRFEEYPRIWHMRRPDPNIDHRRVPNLMVFFQKHGVALPLSHDPQDYLPGEVVCWVLSRGSTHIGIVSSLRAESGRYFIAHNIGQGQVLEDMLFDFKIIAHFRYSFGG
jgi:uncharacterized protein